MRCRRSMERERERLDRALRDLRNEMAGIVQGGTPLQMMLDEALLLGEIKALEYAMGSDPGGWPHDAWFTYVDARKEAIASLTRAGKSIPEVLEILKLSEIEARLILKLDEPDPDKN